MATKIDLQEWIIKALKVFDGQGTIVQVAEYIWKNHSNELETSGSLFYTWQYDMRWAATELRKKNVILSANESHKGR